MLLQRLKLSPLGVHHGVGQLAYPVALWAPIYMGMTPRFGVGYSGQRDISKTLSKVDHLVRSTHFFIK